MNGIVNNPSKTIVISNVTINDAVTIVNRMINNNSYKIVSVDNSMSSAHVWTCIYHSKIHGLVDTMLEVTYSFVETNKGVQLTIECGKVIGSISDQWELQDCNLFIKEAMQIAVNPNINNSQSDSSQSDSSSSSAAGVIFSAIAIIAFLIFIFS